MTDQPRTNVFSEVHAKIQARKDRMAAANREDRELREGKLAEETNKLREVERS